MGPGIYTVEAVVHDGVANHAGVRMATIDVPRQSDDRPRLSSIVLVRRSEKVPAADRHDDNPLYVGDLLLYPNAGDPVSRSQDRNLTFYYAIYPPRSSDGPPRADVELRRNGQGWPSFPRRSPRPTARGESSR